MLVEIRSFLNAAFEADPPSMARLVRSLDALALAYDDAGDAEPAEADIEARPSHYEETCATLRRRWPELGYYAIVNPLVLPPEEAITGDAIDDLADIASDLDEVLYRAEVLGADDALWHFKFTYEIHWGWHLHELRLYLNALKFRSGLS